MSCSKAGAANGPKKPRGVVCVSADAWQVSLDVPDFGPDQLCVKVCENVVEIRGDKSGTSPCKNKDDTFCERYELPCDVDPNTVAWDYCDCKLTVTAQKKQQCP